ncbi:MAG: TonB-dependent receptor [Aquabacterium sp.]
MSRFALSTLATAALLVATFPHAFTQAYAAEAPATEDNTLETIVVSGSREGTSKRKTPAAIDVISGAKIEEKRPTFIGEVLNQAAGVYMSDLRNEQHMMSIRHPLNTNAVYLYMEDGLPIRPAALFNHNALYELNMEGVDRIEVLRGPASSLYGSNAVGGAVNFFTATSLDEPEAQLGAQFSNEGYKRLDFAASTGQRQTAYGDQGLRVTGYRAIKRGGSDDYNDADKASLTLRHDWRINSRTALKTTLSSNHLETDMPGGLTQTQYETQPGFSPQTFTYRKVHAVRFAAALQGEWNPGGQTTATFFTRDNITDQLPSYLIFNTGPTTASGRIVNQNFTSVGLDIKHRQDLGESHDWRWISGALYDRSPMNGFERNLSITKDGAGRYVAYTLGSVRRDYSVLVTTQALYTQLEAQPMAGLTVVAGLRQDETQYAYTNKLSTGAPSESRSYGHVSPKLGATYSINSHSTWFANYSQGFTPPEVSAQYGGSATSPNLKPAVFDNVDVGWRWQDPVARQQLELAVYQLDGHDEQLSYTIAPGQSETRNAGSTTHRGIEFSARQHWGRFSAGLSGTYAQHRYNDYQVSSTVNYAGKDIKSAPKWLANLDLGWQASDHLKLSANVQHLSSYWMNDLNTVKYGGHHLLNLQAKWFDGQWEIWTKLNNATDKRYAESISAGDNGVASYTVGQPRTLWLGMRYHFGAKSE